MDMGVAGDNDTDRQAAIDSIRVQLSQFGNLLMKSGDVVNGFPEQVPLDSLDGNARVDPEMLEENLMFGTPEQVIKKLKPYEGIGVDGFIYYASMGMDMEQQKRSLKLFIEQVMPEFA
jgi:alkanesulfonate monooxygenase SsuD/methylene tetrahydromethanopterin reductase-like flavin-dependent oxidoreductase (luciferase family)